MNTAPDTDTATALAATFADTAVGHDRDGSFPRGHFRVLCDAGLLAQAVLERLESAGAGFDLAVTVARTVSTACTPIGLVSTMQHSHTTG